MFPDIKKAIDDQMKDSHKSWRCSLHKYFKKIGGEISPEIKRLPPDDIINDEDWEWLCDYCSTEEQIMNLETKQFIGDIEFHRVMYTNHKTKQWCNSQAEQNYTSNLQMQHQTAILIMFLSQKKTLFKEFGSLVRDISEEGGKFRKDLLVLGVHKVKMTK